MHDIAPKAITFMIYDAFKTSPEITYRKFIKTRANSVGSGHLATKQCVIMSGGSIGSGCMGRGGTRNQGVVRGGVAVGRGWVRDQGVVRGGGQVWRW
jgi:hypothetical protein